VLSCPGLLSQAAIIATYLTVRVVGIRHMKRLSCIRFYLWMQCFTYLHHGAFFDEKKGSRLQKHSPAHILSTFKGSQRNDSLGSAFKQRSRWPSPISGSLQGTLVSDPNSQSFGNCGLPRGSHPVRCVIQDDELQQRSLTLPGSSDPKLQITTGFNVAYYVFTGIMLNGLIPKSGAEKPEGAPSTNSPS